MVVSKSTVGSQHIVTRVFPHTSFSVEYTFHGSAGFCWHMVVFRTEGFNCKWLQSLCFCIFYQQKKRNEAHFFTAKAASPYPKISKLVRFLIWVKAFQLLCWFYKCFFLTCIIVMDSKAEAISSFLTFIPSFFFYILDKPNMEMGFYNGMVTFVIDFYHVS